MISSIFELLNKYNINKEEALLIGNSILNNQLVVKYGYLPEKVDNPIKELYFSKEFNWIVDLQDKTNMAMLHLHAWEPVNYLLLAHYYTSNNLYVKKAVEIIDDWYEHSLVDTHKYLNYPHCVSDRSLILSYLIEIGITESDSKYISQLIESHKSFLIDDENYVKFNHGIMMDRSLISLSMVIDDEDTLDYAVNRVRNNISRTFTKNMICVENSFTYAIFNLELIISTQKYLLEQKNIKLFIYFEHKINKALDFLNIAKKPDGSFPIYGDGELITVSTLKDTLLYKFYSNHILFSTRSDSTQEIRSYYYKDEGYIILKNNDFHLFIRIGDIVKNHKHADDLSFTLFWNQDIFIDPGIYNYDKGTIRDYLKSSYAHNNIVLNDENYHYLTSTRNEIYLDTFEENEKFFYIRLVNKAYDFSIIKRSFYILKCDYSIIIVDNISTPFSVKNTQTFNLSPSFKKSFKFSYLNQNIICINNELMIGSLEVDDINLVYNDKSLYSEVFQQSESIPRIELNKFEKDATFITVLSRNTNNDILKKLKYENNTLIFSYLGKNYKHSLSLTKEPISVHKYININKIDDTFIVETFYSVFKYQEYAWYIYKDGIRESIIWYQRSPVFNYDFKNSGEYKIRCFIRDVDNKENKKEFSVVKNIFI